MSKKISIALIGAGQRGMDCYGQYALRYPDEAQFVAVAEPSATRRENFKQQHGLSDEYCFNDWQNLLAQPRLADALLICTLDTLHFEPVMAALQAGYHVLVEKPLSPDPYECLQMGKAAAEAKRVFLVGHVLRYTDFFSTLKHILEENQIGQLISIQHNENVAFWHYAHSYVRGNWRNTKESSPMILAKSCHDMDILLWLANSDCTHISSFGSLSYFTAQIAPEGAPDRCLDGCPVANTCPYYAPRFYITGQTGWPASVISNDLSTEGILKVLKEGPYGRCVYHCDNDVVDHQVVNIEFASGATAAFTMCAFTNNISRTIKLMGTRGEIRGVIDQDRSIIEITEFGTGVQRVFNLHSESGTQGHGGGDAGIMRHFVQLVKEDGQKTGLTSAANSVQSHMMAFAAEQSRLEKKVINLQDFYHLYDQ